MTSRARWRRSGTTPSTSCSPCAASCGGRDATRAYYEYFFAHFLPKVAGYELRNEWVTDEGLGQEYVMEVTEGDGRTRSHAIIGILTFGSSGKLSGERLYASDEVLGMMFGPVLERTTPI